VVRLGSCETQLVVLVGVFWMTMFELHVWSEALGTYIWSIWYFYWYPNVYFIFCLRLFCYDVCHTDSSICKITWSVLLILPHLRIQKSTNTLRNSWKERIYHICNMVVVSYSCWGTRIIDNIIVTIWHLTVAQTPFRNCAFLFALDNIPFLDHVRPHININKQWAVGLT
jgi:hypothetical protein